MTSSRLFAATALALAAASAQATVSAATAGATTTLTEAFDAGNSFSGGALAGLGADKFLWLNALAPSASYTFTVPSNATVSLSFWYSGSLDSTNGAVSLASLNANLGATPGDLLQWAANNPGAATAGANDYDAQFTHTFANLASGSYTLSFTKLGSAMASLKIDDIKLTVTAVPEPASVAMMLAGLGVVGAAVRRQRRAGR